MIFMATQSGHRACHACARAQSKGKGWAEYRYHSPANGNIEKRSPCFLKQGDVIQEAGIYNGK